jgi:hypothetical protein
MSNAKTQQLVELSRAAVVAADVCELHNLLPEVRALISVTRRLAYEVASSAYVEASGLSDRRGGVDAGTLGLVSAYVEARVERIEQQREAFSVLYKDASTWLALSGQTITANAFARALRGLGFARERRDDGAYYWGLRLRPQAVQVQS